MAPVPIEDPADPRLEPYRAVRERDLVGRHGRFIAEGAVVVGRLLSAASRFRADSLLLSQAQAAAKPDLVAAAAARGVPVYAAAQPALDAVAGFPVHRGVLALGRRGEGVDAPALLAGLGPHALVVVLIGLANHDNVGGVFRNAAAFGADAVLMDAASCDPLYRKALRVSVGTVLTTPFARAGAPAALLDALAAEGFTAIALSPRGATELAELARPKRAALLLGAEGQGLPDAVLARAHPIRIAMPGAARGGVDSLNVAAASAVALWRLTGDG